MILAIKTAGTDTDLHLINPNGKIVHTKHWESGRTLSDRLLNEILELLKEPKYQLADLTGIIIFSGPGSFTSLRIGHTVANALAESQNIGIVGTMGDDWIEQGIRQWSGGKAKYNGLALPHYGAEAHITKPKS
jgi:tRNA threonylcarbamoyladenosine biosynthesis protein TsaB